MVYTSSYKGCWGNFDSPNWFPLLLHFCLISSHSSLQSNKEKAVCTELWGKVLLISIKIPWLLLTEWPASSRVPFSFAQGNIQSRNQTSAKAECLWNPSMGIWETHTVSPSQISSAKHCLGSIQRKHPKPRREGSPGTSRKESCRSLCPDWWEMRLTKRWPCLSTFIFFPPVRSLLES